MLFRTKLHPNYVSPITGQLRLPRCTLIVNLPKVLTSRLKLSNLESIKVSHLGLIKWTSLVYFNRAMLEHELIVENYDPKG